ncbi:MAG: response regulator [Candidatus Helarchaeota archaeon]
MVDILVVDDEESICEVLKWILEKEGYQVITSNEFENAEEIIRTRDFDIFLIDLVLPGGRGIDLIKLIKDLKKKGSVIIITGYPNIPTLVDSIRLDTYDYIKKPFSQEELKEIISLALTHQRSIEI